MRGQGPFPYSGPLLNLGPCPPYLQTPPGLLRKLPGHCPCPLLSPSQRTSVSLPSLSSTGEIVEPAAPSAGITQPLKTPGPRPGPDHTGTALLPTQGLRGPKQASGHRHRQWAFEVCSSFDFVKSTLSNNAPPSTCWRGEDVTSRPTSLPLWVCPRGEVLSSCG